MRPSFLFVACAIVLSFTLTGCGIKPGSLERPDPKSPDYLDRPYPAEKIAPQS